MAYVSALEGGYGLGASVIANDSSQHAVIVPDADLLFNGAFRRAGPDLILTGHDGRHHTVPGYFSSEHPPALVAPNGASLAADTVGLLAGSPTPGQYAQAAPATPPDAIGHVEKVVGDCTVIRNGASVTLNVGDAVYKSDVIQTGAGASAGISFPDGTALNLVANTRMALNEYSYDPNSNSNAALMTLVEGTFAFVAGKVAHTGDMKIVTPVATMGIRGTTGVVEEQPATVTSNQGQLAYSFAVVQDFGTNVNGAYTLCYTDPNTGACQVFTTIAQTGYLTMVTPQGIGQAPNISVEPLSGAQLQFEQQITHELFELLSPVTPTPNSSNGSSTPQPYINPNPNPQQYDNNGTPLYVFAPPEGPPPNAGPPGVQPLAGGPTAVVIWVSGSGNWDTATDWSDGYVASSISLVEIFAPVTVTLSDGESAGGLYVGTGATVDIVNGGTLTISDEINGPGTVELNSTGSDPALAVDGTVTLKGGGTILMTGTPGDDNIVGLDGSDAKLVNVDYTITGAGTIGHDGDGELTFVNEGTVDATGLLTIHTGNEVANTTTGLMEATAGGTLQIEDDVGNCGIVEACGHGSTVSLLDLSFDNMGSLIATKDGAVTLSAVFLTNETGATFEATHGGSITYDTGNITNDGSILACDGAITFEGSLEINNNAGATFEATAGGSITLDGADGLSLTNLSTIEADNGGTITFDQVAVTNYGATIEAEAGGTVVIETDGGPGVFGGTIQADGPGSTVQLVSASLNDLTLESSGGGVIEAMSGTSTLLNDTFDGTTLDVESGATVDLSGGSTGIAAVIDGTVTFEGSGTVTLDAASYRIVAGGSGAVLDDDTTIKGSGQIGTGNNSLTLNIGSAGAIDATGLLVIATGENIVQNAGLLESSTINGSLIIEAGLDNTGTVKTDDADIQVSGPTTNQGLIEASGGQITISSTQTISNLAGGTIEDNGGYVTLSGNVLTGSAISNAGLIEETDGTVIITGVGGSIDNYGTMTADGGLIDITGVASFTNGGNIINHDGGVIDATDHGKITLTAGTIVQTASVTNEAGGVIKADGGEIDFSASGGVTNELGATIEAENGGLLVVLDEISGTFDNAGQVVLNDGSLHISGALTLNGGGDVELDGSGDAITSAGFGAPAILTNVDNTISGAGIIGNGPTNDLTALTLINEGTIDANVAGGTLTLDTGTNTITNTGLLEATAGGALDIESNVTNTGGTISASGTDSAVNLFGVTITGGTLASSDGGIIENPSGISTLIGVTIDGGSALETSDDTFIDFQGTTTLQGGTVTLEGGGTFVLSGAYIVGGSSSGAALDNEGTLTGAGVIGNGGTTALSLTNDGTIDADVSGGTLTIETGSTVTNNATMEATGGGTLAIDDSIDNESGGVISATGAGSTVSITYNGGDVNNYGMEEAVAGGTLNLTDNSGGVGNYSGGTIEANGAGSTVSITGGVDNNGMIEAVDGGTLTVNIDNDNNNNGGVGNFGTIEADDGTVSIIATVSDAVVLNSSDGTIEAVDGGAVSITANVTNESGGVISASGSGSSVTFDPDTVTNDGQIGAASGGTVTFDDSHVTNESSGNIGALSGGEVKFEHSHIDNYGQIGPNGGTVVFDHSTIHNYGGSGGETIEGIAADSGGSITFQYSDLVNCGAVTSQDGSSITFEYSSVDNTAGTSEDGNGISAFDGGTVTFEHSHVDNSGEIRVFTGSDDGGSAGTIYVDDSTIDNAGGTISVIGSGDTVQLSDATIQGGTLFTDLGGVFEVVASADGPTLFDGSTDGTLTIQGAVDVENGADLALAGTITDNGTITLEAGSDPDLVIDGCVHLNGDGAVLLNGSGDNIVGGCDGGTLYNASSIVGAGMIGGDGLALVNKPCGVINADNSCTALVIDTSCIAVCNAGLLEASCGGTLELKSDVDNSCSGVIEAVGCGSTVDLDQVTVSGGTLETSCGGLIQTVCGSGNSTFDSVTIAADSAVLVNDGSSLTLQGSIDNKGTITLAAAVDPKLVIDGDDVTLNGNGEIKLNGAGDCIVGASGDDANTLTNYNTIDGAGAIGNGGCTDLTLTNDGIINADVLCQTLTINTGANEITNYGTLEATDGGTLVLDSALDNSNLVVAQGHGSTINIDADVTNESSEQGSGQIEAQSCGSITFDSVCVTNDCSAAIDATGGGAITFDCSHLINCGEVSADCGGTVEFCHGTVDNYGALIDDNFNGIQTGDGGTITFDCSNVVNTGYIGAAGGSITFDDSCVNNSGGVLSDGNGIMAFGGGTITIEDSHIDNTGFIRAGFYGDGGCDGTISIDNSTIDNAGGTIWAVNTDSSVQLFDATICGGTLLTDDSTLGDSGIFEIVAPPSDGSNTTVFDGSDNTMDIGGFVRVDAGAVLELKGGIDLEGNGNNGTIALTQTGSGETAIGADLQIDGWVCLNGSGAVTLAGCADEITAGCGGGTLDNSSSIVGAGQIGTGDNSLTLINEACGVINADNASGAALVIDTGCNAVCNEGTLEATGGGTLLIESDVDNSCGTISACGSDSVVQLAAGITIAGGTLATGNRNSAADGMIEILAACAAMVIFDGTAAHAVTIDGYVQVDAGATLALEGTIDNHGTIDLASNSDPSSDLVIGGSVTLQGGGDVTLTAGGENAILSNGCAATLTNVDNTISGAGTIGDANLTLINEQCGTINADVCGQTLAIETGHSISNAGLMEATNGGTLQIADDVCNSGLISASCGGTLDVTAHSITWTGGDSTCAGDNGILLDHGTLLVDSCSLTLDGGGAVQLDDGTISAANCGNILYNADSITGTGTIGCGGLVLNNESCGVIDANMSGETLTLDTGANIVVNCGTLEASNDATLDIKSAIDNCGGTLQVCSGGTLDAEACVTGGTASIAAGSILEFDAAASANVTFNNANGYGVLALGANSDFSGTIYDFTGTCPTLATSDAIDLLGFNAADTSIHASFDSDDDTTTLCVFDSSDDKSITLTFNGQYCTANFVIASDGHGGTYIYDPPTSGGASKGAAPGPAHAAGGPVGVTGAIAGGVPAGTTGALVGASTTTNGAPVGTTGAFVAATSPAETATLNTIAGLLSEFVGDLGVPLGTVATLAATSLPLAADPLGTTSAFVGSAPAATGWTHTTGSTATPTVSAFVSAGGDDVTAQTASAHTAPQNDSAPTPTVGAFVPGAVSTPTVGALVPAPAHHDSGPVGTVGSIGEIASHTIASAGTVPQNEAAPTPTVSAFVPAESAPTPTVGTLVPAPSHGDGGSVGVIGALSGDPAPIGETAGTDGAPASTAGSVDVTGHTAGVATGIGLNFGTDQFVPAPSPLPATGGSTNHVGAVSVALGGSGHDAFVFNSVASPDGFVGVHAPGGSTEVDHVASVQPVETQLASLFTSEFHGGAAFEPVHEDSAVPSAMDQFHQIVATVGHLH